MSTGSLHTVKEIVSGNEKVFESFFKSNYPDLCLYAENFLGDPDECEEVVQEMFLNLWEKRSSLEKVTSIKSYIYRAVKNSCLNIINHNKIKMQYMEQNAEWIKETEQEIEKEDHDETITLRIKQEIDKLPEQRQKIFKLSRFDGLKYKEIAETMNLSVKTIEVQIGKALKTLRTELKQYINVILIILSIFFINK